MAAGLSSFAGLRVVELGVWDNDGFVEIAGAGGPAMRSVNGPVTFSGGRAGSTGPVPGLGEHTGAVLAELAGRQLDGRQDVVS
jgi:crotonobetainyl-CoA:carnitine CoA-transferase CaiB-like acyl-CoA transferase